VSVPGSGDGGDGGLLVPPESWPLGALRLRRLVADDAPAVSQAVTQSLDHLVPWVAWANAQTASVEGQRARLSAPGREWSASSDYEYGIFSRSVADADVVVGACGLHRRSAPGTLEIGYWVHVAYTGRRIASRAAEALTDIGFSLSGVERMEIRCDAANAASAAIPRRLGYVLATQRPRPPAAPGEQGLEQVWRCYRRAWASRAGPG
jgi:ribosomal-protein-serine acetyltransferase